MNPFPSLHPGLCKICLLLVLLLAAPSGVKAQDLASLAGNWKLLFFDTPDSLNLIKDGSGFVTDVFPLNNFTSEIGDLEVFANGTVSGNVEGPFTGTATVTGQGLIQVTINGEEVENFTFFVNTAQDVMISTLKEPGFNETLIAVRLPTSLSAAEAAGDWRLKTYETPRSLTLIKSDGILTEIQEKDDFITETGTVNVVDDGNLTVNLGGTIPGTYSLSGSPAGQVDVTINDGEGDETFSFFMNASMTFMIALKKDPSFPTQELLFMTRQPPAGFLPPVASLEGLWRITSMDSPPSLTLNKTDGKVTEIPERNNFSVEAGHVAQGTDGFLTGRMEGPFTGTASLSNADDLTLTINENGGTEVIGLHLNAAGDILIGTVNDGFSQELILGVKAPALGGTQTLAELGLLVFRDGSAVDVFWATKAGRKLQSSGLIDSGWTDVPDTLGAHTHNVTLSGSGDGNVFFRVIEVDP